jgi:NAD(P)-dependent dehydrogenase (short-subunit alcohol dehydrogenase family)
MREGTTALVTGASSGIGRAVAVALAARGCRLTLSGRSRARLDETASICRRAPHVAVCAGDLTTPATLDELRREVERSSAARLGILVHCAADLIHGEVERVELDELRRLLDVNVVASFALLRALTPLLGSDSDVVLLNSTNGVTSPAGASPYSVTKYALRALADAYRAEVNSRGIRVTSVFCGKTATAMQQRIYEGRGEGGRYDEIKDAITRPQDVAEVIAMAVSLPRTTELTDIHLRPLKKT